MVAAGPEPAAVARAMVAASQAEDAVSAVDLTRLPEVMAAMDGFATTLHDEAEESAVRDALRATLFYEVEDFYTTPGDLAIDVGHMARTVRSSYDWAAPEADVLSRRLTDAVLTVTPSAAHPEAGGLSVHLIPLHEDGTAAAVHDRAYVRGGGSDERLRFVMESAWPPVFPEGPGLLYRLFYEVL